MLGIIKFIFGFALSVQAFIGLSFFVSSIWEKEKRASILAGIQFLGMLILVILFFSLNSTKFFDEGIGLGIMVLVIIVGIAAILLFFLRIGKNPKALKGTKGAIVGEVKQWDERDIEFSKGVENVVKMMPPQDLSSKDLAGAVLQKSSESRDLTSVFETSVPPEKRERVPDDVMNNLGLDLSAGDPNLGKIDGPGGYANAAMTNASMAVVGDFVEPDKLTPPVLPVKFKISPDEASLRIKGYAKNLGACLCGITELEPQWFYTHHGFSGLKLKEWGKEVENNHKYAIIFAEEMDMDLIGAGPHSPTTLETTHNYAKGAFIGVQVARFIAYLGYSAKTHNSGHYDALMVPLAINAGLGELGRMGYLISKEYGPRIRLSAVTTDLPLITDEPIDIGVEDFCSICKKCATCCPSHSIPDGERQEVNGSMRWKLSSETCIEYWQKCGSDCAVCMRVCPWSHARTFPHKIIVEAVSRNRFSRRVFHVMDDIFYGKKPKAKKPPEWASYDLSTSIEPPGKKGETAGVAGTWKLTMETPMGTQEPIVTIEGEGGSFNGTIESPMGRAVLEDILFEDNRVEFKAEVDSPMGKMMLFVKGTIDGDKISGNFETPMGPTPFTGLKQ